MGDAQVVRFRLDCFADVVSLSGVQVVSEASSTPNEKLD